MDNAQLVNQDSGQVEWYTPSAIVEAARRCMGGIDLDPASSEVANQTVKAVRYFTIGDDGLSMPWYGRVWMNHPYSKINNLRWIPKLLAEYATGNIAQGCAIVNASTSERWFVPLYDYPICFFTKRVRFVKPCGGLGASPTKGSAVVYLGPNLDAFISGFGSMGRVMVPAR